MGIHANEWLTPSVRPSLPLSLHRSLRPFRDPRPIQRSTTTNRMDGQRVHATFVEWEENQIWCHICSSTSASVLLQYSIDLGKQIGKLVLEDRKLR